MILVGNLTIRFFVQESTGCIWYFTREISMKISPNSRCVICLEGGVILWGTHLVNQTLGHYEAWNKPYKWHFCHFLNQLYMNIVGSVAVWYSYFIVSSSWGGSKQCLGTSATWICGTWNFRVGWISRLFSWTDATLGVQNLLSLWGSSLWGSILDQPTLFLCQCFFLMCHH